MLLITGPGRSGTSVLALFCQAMGYEPGGAWHESVDAGLEYPRVVQINDALNRALRETGDAAEALAEHRAEMRALDFKVVKDPRFTFHPGNLRAWHLVRPDLSVLLTYRKPEHCLASRQRNAKSLMVKDRTQADNIRRDLANTLEVLLELDIPYRLLLFPQFLDQYDRVRAAFEDLGLPIDPETGATTWNRVVNRDKVHFKAETPEPAEDPAKRKGGWNPFAR
jgi:hypothetical protein